MPVPTAASTTATSRRLSDSLRALERPFEAEAIGK
jgi:hypothetical protein